MEATKAKSQKSQEATEAKSQEATEAKSQEATEAKSQEATEATKAKSQEAKKPQKPQKPQKPKAKKVHCNPIQDWCYKNPNSQHVSTVRIPMRNNKLLIHWIYKRIIDPGSVSPFQSG